MHIHNIYINTLLHVSALTASFQRELSRVLKSKFVVNIRHQYHMPTTGTTTLLHQFGPFVFTRKWEHERFRTERQQVPVEFKLPLISPCIQFRKFSATPTQAHHTQYAQDILTLILSRSRTGTVWFYTSTSNKRAARPKLHTKSLTRDLKLMYNRFTLVRISIKLQAPRFFYIGTGVSHYSSENAFYIFNQQIYFII